MFPSAVLFDFDGTLADSYAAITASVNHVRSLHHLPPLAVERVRYLVGHGLVQLMEDIIPGGDAEANARAYRAHHPSVMLTHTFLLAGVLDALKELRRRDIKMAVCSNKPSQFTKQLLQSLNIYDYFDAVLGPEDSGFPKPDPAMVNLAVKRLGVSVKDGLFVGDMEVDVMTAKAAKMLVWVVLTGSDNEETIKRSNPDRIMSDMNELIPALFEGK